jgi:ATP/maltotriose-dependent transcriptional regulator MalT
MLTKPILSTKLTPPRCFQTYFERKRLVKLLEANKTKIATFIIGGLVMVKALASQWVKNKTSIWVSCDADMNDIESLLSYIVYAFIKNNLNLFPQTSILLSGQNKINKDLLVNTFFTEVNTTTKQTYVVLDDFHL